RGVSTQTAMFVDGVRDLGAVTRDVFNIEQVEVAKGPAGADIGRGAASGYINLVSKLPGVEDFTSATASWATGDSKRLSADANRKIGETAAVRINVLGQQGGVAGRDHVENNTVGIAPSFALGLGTPTRFYLYSQHIRQDNVPDGGIPSVGMEGFYNAVSALASAGKVARENYYGSANDYEKVNADMVTARLEHDLGQGVTLRNISRYGKTTMDRVITGVNAIDASAADPANWTVARMRQRVDQENEILANQTNLTAELGSGFVRHSLSAGLELMYEKQKSLSFGTTAQTINGVSYAAITNPAANLYNPNAGDVLGIPYATGAYTNGSTSTAALYAFDTVKLGERWQLSAGLRFEHYGTDTDGRTLVTTGTNGNIANYPGYTAGQLAPDALSKSGNLLSWKVGALYKPADNGSVYLAYANSLTPPGGANFALSASASNTANAAMDPQGASNIELGTKWDVLDAKLALTAALYRTEITNEVAQLDPVTNTYAQFGKRSVQGIELGAVGQITNLWQVSAGLATMKTNISEGTTGNTAPGAATRWSPDLTATLWSTYALTPDFTFGGGARYVSEQKRVVDPSVPLATQNMPDIPSYWVADAMASYKLSRNASLRLNVYNLFDKFYINTLNNSGARLALGAPRSAMLSANVQF
ncbi:MAG: catecholate siderophore receptor Fiu, partial [Zoogloea sp.]|nr:catecholate siderophore receptor Fiu [Zoogloea sp.]